MVKIKHTQHQCFYLKKVSISKRELYSYNVVLWCKQQYLRYFRNSPWVFLGSSLSYLKEPVTLQHGCEDIWNPLHFNSYTRISQVCFQLRWKMAYHIVHVLLMFDSALICSTFLSHTTHINLAVKIKHAQQQWFYLKKVSISKHELYSYDVAVW